MALVNALKFESTLAIRIVDRKSNCRSLMAVVGALFAVFLVLNFTSGSMAGDQAVIQLGSKSSVARYLGQFDGRANVMMLGAMSSIDWICIQIPFKGHLSDVKSIAYSEFIAQVGGEEALEPYLVLRLTEGRSLVCNPVSSYSNGTWNLPLLEWQTRDAATKGTWTFSNSEAKSTATPLTTWVRAIGDANVLSINLFIGRWSISFPYQCYVADLSVNDKRIDISNAARIRGSLSDLPLGF